MKEALRDNGCDARAQFYAKHARLVQQAERLRETECELQQFLSEYYAAIAQDIMTLVALEAAKGTWMGEHLPNAKHMHEAMEAAAIKTRATLSREAYRSAARNAHPDVVRDAQDTNMQRVNRAREEDDIATLLAVAMQPKHSGEDWEVALTELARWEQQIHDSTEALFASPAYALYLKAFEAKLAGRNWLEDTTQNIRRAVALETRAIAKQGVQAIAQWRVA